MKHFCLKRVKKGMEDLAEWFFVVDHPLRATGPRNHVPWYWTIYILGIRVIYVANAGKYAIHGASGMYTL